jgi:hypothetical protein
MIAAISVNILGCRGKTRFTSRDKVSHISSKLDPEAA